MPLNVSLYYSLNTVTHAHGAVNLTVPLTSMIDQTGPFRVGGTHRGQDVGCGDGPDRHHAPAVLPDLTGTGRHSEGRTDEGGLRRQRQNPARGAIMIRALLADDQDLVRAGLRALLGNEPKITVVAEAATGDDAIAMTRKHHPDVVLMDIRMPGTKGIEATRRIRADPALSATRILILTTFDDDDDILEAIRLGAAGYLLKDTPSDDLRAAVRTIASGDNLLSPNIARRVMEHVADMPSPGVHNPTPRRAHRPGTRCAAPYRPW